MHRFARWTIRDADYQLLVDIRSFQIDTEIWMLTAEIGFSARILNKDGQVVASRLFQQRRKLDKPDPASAVAAFNDAFGQHRNRADHLDG